jgi:hypothetical protein
MKRSNNDLVPLMAPFFDVHMVVPLIDFLAEVRLILVILWTKDWMFTCFDCR